MKIYLSFLVVCMLVLFSCTTKTANVYKQTFNTNQLEEQDFIVNKTRDTILYTRAGVKITIGANSIESSSDNVTLQVKEALTMQQMMLAGLTTQSKSGPLSSGGMIFINTKESSTIKKPIHVSIPTPDITEGMQVYNGEINSDSSISWQEPEPLDTIASALYDMGQKLFTDKCAACHGVAKDLTGPALRGATKRNNMRWLYGYTRNNQEVLKSGDEYGNDLYLKFNKTVMPAFPDLTDMEIKSIYYFIDNCRLSDEDIQKSIRRDTGGIYIKSMDECADSCFQYFRTKDSLEEVKMTINEQRADLSMVEYNLDSTTPSSENNQQPTAKKQERQLPAPQGVNSVSPESFAAEYYNFSITSFGWYNVDILMKDDPSLLPSELVVNVTNETGGNFNLYLIIPSKKVLVEGGKLDGNIGYGFYDKNGSIPLPQNVPGFVFAVGESENKSFFGITKFYCLPKQTISLTLNNVNKDDIEKAFQSYNFDGLNMKVENVKNPGAIKTINESLNSAEKLKPLNCNCGEYDFPPVTKDSIKDSIIFNYLQ